MGYRDYLALRPERGNGPLRELATAQNELLRGRFNIGGTFTLASDGAATTTMVTDILAHAFSVPVWVPTTASAADALAKTYLSASANGQFTIGHDADIATDRTFVYVLLG